MVRELYELVPEFVREFMVDAVSLKFAAKGLLKKKLAFTLAKFEARHSVYFFNGLGFLGN